MLVHQKVYPGIPTTIRTMGVNISTIAYLRVLIIEIGSTIVLMVVEAQGTHLRKFVSNLDSVDLFSEVFPNGSS